jgi:hypothetical protein
MNQPEFTAMQVTVLVRTSPGGGLQVKELFDSVPFQYQLQDALGTSMKERLRTAEVDFEEVIISLDTPAQKAKRVHQKASLMGRLFGRS